MYIKKREEDKLRSGMRTQEELLALRKQVYKQLAKIPKREKMFIDGFEFDGQKFNKHIVYKNKFLFLSTDREILIAISEVQVDSCKIEIIGEKESVRIVKY